MKYSKFKKNYYLLYFIIFFLLPNHDIFVWKKSVNHKIKKSGLSAGTYPLQDAVQGINCINFDNFRATQRFVRGHNPAYIMHVAPPLLYSDPSVLSPLLYSDPSVLSPLPNDVVGPCVTTTLHKWVLCVHTKDSLSDLKIKFRDNKRAWKTG